MTCQHFRYEVGRRCVTLPTCPIHQGLMRQGIRIGREVGGVLGGWFGRGGVLRRVRHPEIDGSEIVSTGPMRSATDRSKCWCKCWCHRGLNWQKWSSAVLLGLPEEDTLSVLSTSQEVSRSPTSLPGLGLSSFYGPDWFLKTPGCPENVWVKMSVEIGVMWVDIICVGGNLKCLSLTRRFVLTKQRTKGRNHLVGTRCS